VNLSGQAFIVNFSTTREHGSLEITELREKENNLTGKIIGAAIDVHRVASMDY